MQQYPAVVLIIRLPGWILQALSTKIARIFFSKGENAMTIHDKINLLTDSQVLSLLAWLETHLSQPQPAPDRPEKACPPTGESVLSPAAQG